MKLSNAIIYRSMLPAELDAEVVEEAMRKFEFVPTGPTQEHAIGWVPPRGEKHGALIEVIDGQWVMELMIETRAVPGTAVRKRVDERAEGIEKVTGRKPGTRERKELKEDALRELLPRAFPKQSRVAVWLNPEANRIVIDSSSSAKADQAASMLVQSIEGLALSLLQTTHDPRRVMAAWLLDTDSLSAGFTIDRDAELCAVDESKAVVKYTKHPLDTEHVREQVQRGLLPSKLAMTWDDRVSFVLTEGMSLRSINFIDGVMSGPGDAPPEDEFDANVAISTGETAMVIAALIEALGGEAQMTIAEAEQPAASHPLGDEPDPLVDQARAIVIEKRKPSISLVQRYLKIGYNRAARLLETLEQRGVVSAMGKDGTRTLLEVA